MRTRAPIGLLIVTVLFASGLTVAAPAAATGITASDLPALLTVAAPTTSPSYDRDRFEHWIDDDANGCNTRYEVLIQESTTPVAVGERCALEGGTWVSALDGTVGYSPADVQIDHHVALAEAWRSGASGWDDAQRRAFANDLGVPYALNVSSPTANQSKADRDPASWLPPNDAYVCEYVISWALVKYRWSLAVDPAEVAALTSELSGDCGATPVDLPEIMIAMAPTAPEPDPDAGGEPEVPIPTTTIAPLPEGQTRLAGADRYQTALQVSARYASGVPAVFVATGTNFPDALSAASAAALLGGPLLLTPTASLPVAIADEIRRLAPAKIYVVGGESVVSRNVFTSLGKLAPTERLSGSDRYETGRAIVRTTFPTASTAFIATGRNFPDALAATGAAGSVQAPVILVDENRPEIPPATVQLLVDLGVTNIVIAGSASVVPARLEQQLRSRFAVARYGGSDRYQTASLINDAFFAAGSTDARFLATGQNFPDALAGAALAGYLRAPMHVTRAACTPETVHASVARLGASKIAVMGGTTIVSAAAASNIGCLAATVPTVSGTARVGSTLTAGVGTWTSGTSFRYQWLANGAVVSGATGSSLTLGTAHQGKRMSVRVTGTKSGFTTVSATSAQTGAVAKAPAPPAPPTPSRPANPGDTKNCGDFATWRQAQNWFDTYYPHYGDVAKLDADKDRIACESLPGAP